MAFNVTVGTPVQGTTTNLVPTLPTYSAGDVVLLVAAAPGSTANRVVSFPGTYTQIGDVGNTPASLNLDVAWKYAGSSESNPTVSIVSASSGWSVVAVIISGVDGTSALDATSVADTSSSATTWTPSGITTNTDGAMVLSIVDSKDSNALALSTDQGFTLELSYSQTANVDHTIGIASKVVTSAGAVTNPTWQETANGPDPWCGFTMALVPASTSQDADITATAKSMSITILSPTLYIGSPFTLSPNADGSRSVVVNELDETANLYASVDDDPDSPNTSDWITAGASDGYVFLDLESLPADFDSIETPITVRAYVSSTGYASDTCTVYAQIFEADMTTNLTDEQALCDETDSGLVTANLTVNATGLAANKSVWDNATLKLRWDYTA